MWTVLAFIEICTNPTSNPTNKGIWSKDFVTHKAAQQCHDFLVKQLGTHHVILIGDNVF